MTEPAPPRGAYEPAWVRRADGRRIVVAGADGFIGSHTVRAALAAGASVNGICVKRPWRLADLASERLDLARFEGPWWQRSALEQLRPALRQADALVLLLYEPPVSGVDPLEHERRVNRDSALSMAALAAEDGVAIVFSSTADVYGPWHHDPVNESVTPAPVTPYARVKLETEQSLRDRHGHATIVRIATVYGPGENGPRAIPTFARACIRGRPAVLHGDGSDIRDYVHVADVAGALVNASFAAMAEALVVNVGSGRGRTTREILEAVAAALGSATAVRREPSVRRPSRLVLDHARATSSLGFAARMDFEVALKEQTDWLRGSLDALEARSPISH